MEKCSLTKHNEIDAVSYCEDCRRNMCKKCHAHHEELFENHDLKILNDDVKIEKEFTGFCHEKNHSNTLEYFCKNHNKLCCAACISKIQSKGNGQHKDCDICDVEDIKDDKLKILKDNMKTLEELSNAFEKIMDELKKSFEKANREMLKVKIEKIFAQIKEAVNEREKEIMEKVDYLLTNDYEDLFSNEEKKYENTFLVLKESIKKSKELKEEKNEIKKMNSYVNDCLNIENNVKKINNDITKLKEEISLNKIDSGLNFYPDENDDLNTFLQKIRTFGCIFPNTDNFKFKKCPEKISKNKLYSVSGKRQNILTKSGEDGWVGVLCQNGLEKSREKYSWKIKILNSYNKTIMVGVAPIDFDINSSSYSNNGWYFYCYCSSLYSGSPHNYNNRKTKFKKVREEIKIVLNMNNRTLKFIVDGEDNGETYSNIPTDKPLFPTVFLYHKNDSVKILEYR